MTSLHILIVELLGKLALRYSLFGLLSLALSASGLLAQVDSRVNWLELVGDGLLVVEELTGVNPFRNEVPHLQITITNTTTEDITAYWVAGDVLQPNSQSEGYCSIVLAGSPQPFEIGAGQTLSTEINGYCRETSDQARRPDVEASYLGDAGIIYGGNIDLTVEGASVQAILDRARQANLLESFATQLAVWQTANQLTDTELGQFGDVAQYAEELDYLQPGEPLPAEPPTAVTVTPTPSTFTVTPNTPQNGQPLATFLTDLGRRFSSLWNQFMGLQLVYQLGIGLLVSAVIAVIILLVRRWRHAYTPSGDPDPFEERAPTKEPQDVQPNAEGARVKEPVTPPLHMARWRRRKREFIRYSIDQESDTVRPPWAQPADPAAFMDSSDQPYVEDLETDSREASSRARSQNRELAYVLFSPEGTEAGRFGDEGVIITGRRFGNAQIVLDDIPGVSSPHARIRFHENRTTLKDLNSNHGTFVNGIRLAAMEEHTLTNGALVQFGSDRKFVFGATKRQLTPLSQQHAGRALPLENDKREFIVTGRYLQEIVIPLPYLSSPHLLLYPVGQQGHKILVKHLGGQPAYIVNSTDQRVSLAEQPDGEFVSDSHLQLSFDQSEVFEIQSKRLRPHKRLGKFIVEKVLSESKLSYVYQVRDIETNELYVAKVLNKLQQTDGTALSALKNEIHRMQELALSRGFLRCLVDGTETMNPYFITHYLAGKDLELILKSNPGGLHLSHIELIFSSLFGIVGTLHERNLAHCDIKPSNILVAGSNNIYLIDLGSVTPFGEPPQYISRSCAPPEFTTSHGLPVAASKTDVYSLGLVLFRSLTGLPPNQAPIIMTTGNGGGEILTKLTNSPASAVAEHFAPCLTSALVTDPGMRSEFAEFVDQVSQTFKQRAVRRRMRGAPDGGLEPLIR